MKKMSGLFIMFLIFSLLGGTIYAQEDSTIGNQEFQTLKSYGIVDDSLYNNKNVNRADCVTAIMKVIGMSAEEEAHVCGEAAQVVFSDEGTDYVWEAGKSIALGDGNHTFFPDKDVTVKEVSAFMVRCLVLGKVTGMDEASKKARSMSLDATFAKAKDLGLIQSIDDFYNDGNATITPNEFCVILNRMLYQKRYMYYDYKTFQVQFDTTGSGKYIDYLKKIE